MEYKAMVPSQLIAERGSDIVVINPGSSNVRLGIASAQSPIVIPHVIAWLATNTNREVNECNFKGAIGEEKFSTCALSGARRNEREEVYQLIEAQLRLRTSWKEEGRGIWQRKEKDVSERWMTTPMEGTRDSLFSWTQVELEGNRMSSSFESSSCDQILTSDLSLSDKQQSMQPMYKFICGDAALKIPSNKPYSLRRPICRGRLNISECYSLQQVCDDIFAIWNWALTLKLDLPEKRRQHLSAVLIVPDTLDSREIKEILTVILKDLQFHSAVVHQESVSATFGNGVSSACIVNLGAQVSSVICVEDGVALPTTRMILPFGGDDITRCLLWVEQRLKSWPTVECNPLHNPMDMLMLTKVKEEHCCIKEGEQHVSVELCFQTGGLSVELCRVTLSSLNIPAMGLFYPALLTPEEYVPLSRPWYHADTEDILLDDAIHAESGRRSDLAETGSLIANQSVTTFVGNVEQSFATSTESRDQNEDCRMGIHQAIANSILSIGRMDIQKKMFSSIQLVGGVGLTPGLIDAIEERVLQAIPVHELIDTVEVIQSRTEASIASWKGGAVLGILDSARDTWIQHDDWTEGGVHVGTGKKYKDSYFLQTQTFWYTSS
eukprot:c24788_g1_i1 orf=403-2223(-)